MSIGDPTITETNADFNVNFAVTLDHAVQGGFDVAISSTNGTADGTDYTLNTTTLHFAGTAGESHNVSVTIKGDTVVEANETFTVNLGAVTGTTATQIAAITSTDTGDRHDQQRRHADLVDRRPDHHRDERRLQRQLRGDPGPRRSRADSTWRSARPTARPTAPTTR